VRFVDRPEDLEPADLVILPGTKSTLADLGWLRESGFARRIEERAARGEPIVGVCGGCQMLGVSVEDPHRVESTSLGASGLALLPIRTRFESQKITAQIAARPGAPSFLTEASAGDEALSGYEIHMGMLSHEGGARPAFRIVTRNGSPSDAIDGAVSPGGHIVGTMIHGIFENVATRRSLVAYLCTRKGIAPPAVREAPSRLSQYDRLAAAAREHLDGPLLRRLAGLPERPRA
jgi:adenosylcobyric acid synthase